MRPTSAKTEIAPEPTVPPEHAFRGVTMRNFTISLLASHRVRNRIDDVSDHTHRTVDSANDAIDHTRYAAHPAVEDVRNLLHLLKSAIHTLTNEGSTETDRVSRALRARADQLRRAANERTHQARERMDWTLDRTGETIMATPFKSVSVTVAIGAATELVAALASGSSRRGTSE